MILQMPDIAFLYHPLSHHKFLLNDEIITNAYEERSKLLLAALPVISLRVSEELETSAGSPYFQANPMKTSPILCIMVIFRRACQHCRRNRSCPLRKGKESPLPFEWRTFSAHCPMSPDIFFGHSTSKLYLCVIAVTGHLKTQDFGATGHFSEFVGMSPPVTDSATAHVRFRSLKSLTTLCWISSSSVP